MRHVFGARAPLFGIKQVRISNVGIIDDLTLTFEDPSLLAICAGNGIGKTTILESISLLGHLPCFPTLERSGSQIQHSEVARRWPGRDEPDYSYYSSVVAPADLNRLGIDGWLDQNRGRRGYGTVEFQVFDGRGEARYDHHFVILVHSCRLGAATPPRLTDMLSRGDFDDYHRSDISFADDRFLGSCGLVLYDRNEQHGGQTLEDLIRKLALGRTFHIFPDGGGEPRVESFSAADFPGVDGPRAVAYLNTDLNDFGRGNDLRESPKDLTRDFGAEMVCRLRIQFSDDGIFKHLKKLRGICARILQTPLSHYSVRNVLPADFYLKNIRKSGAGAAVTVDRLDGGPAVDVNFLSAGENEVFFVSLVTLNAVENPALGPTIILLDEPDLHIANVARSRFFSEILSLVDGRSQLILSTHSAALFNVLRRRCKRIDDKVQVVYRVVESVARRQFRMASSFDRVFLGRMRNVDRDSNLLAGIWNGFTAFFWLEVARTKSSLVGETGYGKALTLVSLALASAILFVVIAIGALINDSLYGQSVKAFQFHAIIVQALGGDLLVLVACLLTIIYVRFRARKAHARLVEEVKRPLREELAISGPDE